MQKLTKGSITKQSIISEARMVFNEFGSSLTLNELASKMGVTIGRITNHFHTKDNLFVALSDDYENQFNELIKSFTWSGGVNLTNLAALLKKVMDLQYEHRCLLLFVCATGLTQHVMLSQISAKWNQNSQNFTGLISSLVSAGILDKSVLRSENFEVLRFQHINLLTTWLVSQTIYDRERPLNKSKKIYLKGVLLTLDPYLTRKGRAEFNRIFKK